MTAGWPADGMFVSQDVQLRRPRLTTDGSGGVNVVWESRGDLDDLFAQRFVDDDVVPIKLSLVDQQFTSSGVKSTWYGKGASSQVVTVYRRQQYREWQELGSPTSSTTDYLTFEDRTTVPGERYAYRLGMREGSTETYTPETWVEVPSNTRLSLAGFQPNPAQGTSVVIFTLPTSQPARLEVIDTRGRKVWTEDVGSRDPAATPWNYPVRRSFFPASIGYDSPNPIAHSLPEAWSFPDSDPVGSPGVSLALQPSHALPQLLIRWMSVRDGSKRTHMPREVLG